MGNVYTLGEAYAFGVICYELEQFLPAKRQPLGAVDVGTGRRDEQIQVRKAAMSPRPFAEYRDTRLWTAVEAMIAQLAD